MRHLGARGPCYHSDLHCHPAFWRHLCQKYSQEPCLGPCPYCNQGPCGYLWFLLPLKAMQVSRLWAVTWSHDLYEGYLAAWKIPIKMACAAIQIHVTSRPRLLPGVMSVFMVSQQSIIHVPNKGHKDTWDLGHHMCPCWGPRDITLLVPCQSM